MINRQHAIEALKEREFDLVVVGGGITGAGVALDAATRGMNVALVERWDYAAGTSSRSSKLVHGGLRYLKSFDLGLVREALLERQLMVSLAPHLVKPLPLVVAALGSEKLDRLVGMGLNLYDVMSVDRLRRRGTDIDWSPARHRRISGDEVARLVPALQGQNPTAGYLFYDCQTDDVRLVLTVLAEAERFGTVAANRLEVKSLVQERGYARGVHLTDLESGESFPVRARAVINATGVWADQLKPTELRDVAEVPRIRPSRGTHILLRHEDLPLHVGAIVPAGGNRTIFALPWLGRTLIGTTDTDYEASDLMHVAPDKQDLGYLLEATNTFFGTKLQQEDIVGAFAGVRPLISTGDTKRSVDISRKAELFETRSGMITITGGKLTTWRRMAKLTVDRLVEREGLEAPCRTHRVSLGIAIAPEKLERVEGVAKEAYSALAARYGSEARSVLALAAQDSELAQPIVPGLPDIFAEILYAVRHEQARSLGDLFARRTRLALLAGGELVTESSHTLERVLQIISRELGWDQSRQKQELEYWFAEAAAEGFVPRLSVNQ